MTASPQGSRTSPGDAPAWLMGLFGSRLRVAEPLPWGFHNETWRVRLADGRLLAVSRLADDGAPRLAPSVLDSVGRRLAEAGLPVPAMVGPWAFESDGVLVTAFAEGTVAAALLSKPSGPRLVGSFAGSVIRALAAFDPTGLAVPALWGEPDRLAAEASRWSSTVAPVLSTRDRRRLEAAIQAVPALRSGRPMVLAHGDLAPVNMLVDDDRLSGLLDLEAVRLADPFFDAAWFDWLMRFHHPAQRDEAWLGLTEAAGLDMASQQAVRLRHVLPTLRILESVAVSNRPVAEHSHWLVQLCASLASWPG